MTVLSFLVTLSFLRPSWWWSLISRRSETDYDLILGRLQKDISESQARLAKVRTRDARASVLFTLYALAFWSAVVAICWSMGFLTWELREGEDPETRAKRTLMWIPLALAPVVIFFTRRIVRWWYHRLAEAEESHIRTLRRTQRDKIDEIKAATRFDRLRLLLEKYDDGPSNKTSTASQNPNKAASSSQSRQQQQQQKPNAATSYRHSTPDAMALARGGNAPSSTAFPRLGGPQAQGPLQPNSAPASGTNRFPTGSAHSQSERMAAPALPVQPPGPRTWMDKLGDALLGADPSQMTAEQRYALVCSACYAHNGLALKEEIEEIQYVCPRCGHFNSRRPSSTPVSSPFGRRDRLDSTATQRERVNSTSSRFSFNPSHSHNPSLALSPSPNENNSIGSTVGSHPYSLKPDGRAYSASHSDLASLAMTGDDSHHENTLSKRFGMSKNSEEPMEELESETEGTPKPDRTRRRDSREGSWGDDSPPPSSPLRKGNAVLEQEGSLMRNRNGSDEVGSPTSLRARGAGRGDAMDLDEE